MLVIVDNSSEFCLELPVECVIFVVNCLLDQLIRIRVMKLVV